MPDFFNAPLGVKPVVGPSRACANHHFSGGYDYASKKSAQNHPENRLVPIFVPSKFFCAQNRPDFTEAIAQICFAECVKVSAGNGVRNHVVIVVSLHENHTVGR